MNLICPRQLTNVQFERFYTAAADKLIPFMYARVCSR